MRRWRSAAVAAVLVTAVAAFVSPGEAQMLRREAYVSVPTLISEAGYPVERHRAVTSDGYHLQLHRISAGRRAARGARVKGKRTVLLVHGLFGSSGDFVIMGPKRSLGYLLADAGYDVWLGNLRGTTYSSHRNLTRQDEAFWNFSFEEHGRYDVPALVDTVLRHTGLEKILYIGYSMGTTSFFVMMSHHPEYNDKIVAFVALAPAVFLDNLRAFATFLLNSVQMTNSMRERGIHSVSVRREVVDALAGGVCSVRRAQDDVCMRLAYGLVGEDYEQNDWEMMPVVLARFQPGSLRQLEHFGKVAIAGEFVEWGGGLTDVSAPSYKLSNTRVPVHLIYGENDQLTEKTQTMRLLSRIRTTREMRQGQEGSVANGGSVEAEPVSWNKFNHLDFVYAKNLDKILTQNLVRLVNKLYQQHYRHTAGATNT